MGSNSVQKIDGLGYWNGDLLVSPMVNEEVAASAYIRFSREGLLERIFNEGPVTLRWFLEQYGVERGVQLLACAREDGGVLVPEGLAWIVRRVELEDPAGNLVLRKAEVGEGFFRGVSPKNTLIYGQLALDFCFKSLNLDAVYGTTAEPNRAGVLYSSKLGFDLHGPLPNYTLWKNKHTGKYEKCSAYISVISRNKWEKL